MNESDTTRLDRPLLDHRARITRPAGVTVRTPDGAAVDSARLEAPPEVLQARERITHVPEVDPIVEAAGDKAFEQVISDALRTRAWDRTLLDSAGEAISNSVVPAVGNQLDTEALKAQTVQMKKRHGFKTFSPGGYEGFHFRLAADLNKRGTCDATNELIVLGIKTQGQGSDKTISLYVRNNARDAENGRPAEDNRAMLDQALENLGLTTRDVTVTQLDKRRQPPYHGNLVGKENINTVGDYEVKIPAFRIAADLGVSGEAMIKTLEAKRAAQAKISGETPGG